MLRTFLVAVFCLLAGFGPTLSGQAQTETLSPEEQKEYELVCQRLRSHAGLINAAAWTLCHCADEKELKAVEKTLNLLQTFADSRQIPTLVEAGGVKQVKDNVADLLRNKDPVVRGFAAVLLAVIGDPAYKSDIAKSTADRLHQVNFIKRLHTTIA